MRGFRKIIFLCMAQILYMVYNYQKYRERSCNMIFVTKEEFEKIKEKIPNVRMTITSKYHKAKRKKRWIEEDPNVLAVLEEIRNS